MDLHAYFRHRLARNRLNCSKYGINNSPKTLYTIVALVRFLDKINRHEDALNRGRFCFYTPL